MREPNFSSTAQNRAAVVISSTLYDRRALDCTATLPLVNSLTHLAYMTSTSPRIREILAADGGLERLVKILATCQYTDKHSLWKWSLAFQCVVNVGVRGTEAIRTRVVEAGAVHIVLAILENFIQALDQAKLDKDQEKKQSSNNLFATALTLPTLPIQQLQQQPSRSTPILSYQQQLSSTSSEKENIFQNNTRNMENNNNSMLFVIPKRRTFLKRTAKPKAKPYTASLSSIPLLNNLSTDAILHREEDILLSLQLLAYLSKYPQIRQAFHNNHRHNVFSVVEKFTHRIHPAAIIYWAGVIMRNACRKDEARGGVRQCANMQCGKWERFPREFAKCRRCRKAKYCSKACQSKAWADGHRWWCVERPHSSHPPNPTATSSTTAAAAAAVVAAAPPPPPPTEQVVHLEDTATSDVMTIPIDTNNTNTNEGNEAGDNSNTTRRSSLAVTTENTLRPPREQELLFYHHTQRRNSRSVRSLASGSSTEVEGDTETTRPRDLMDVD
ncbi:hypothetical protein BCV72DRAFT_303774 [Rhizopus microsporus var. microsporus]|uniref:MYND-type domain-containing protein n=2 Tax=Rhizopus microsporus TaxID=58291 RepID=A0A2G4SVG0_RHIZD|nr:uncharacterized protein RHIMIDRAFT_251650 [Rhizopus microsporus ATCC 52813]ORE08385.1 hypothetical protein BCV72DRAFT_303774 [Rhizopus microsporus var. microsporus]PHZ12722.1 hypothetical protein RHIMIDRAFT_251650 [Rhizopus microsporus ATCC 52813]